MTSASKSLRKSTGSKTALPSARLKRPAKAEPKSRSGTARTEVAQKPARTKKIKLVRDSFTMPEDEYALIAKLKERCLAGGIAAKKSEILRVAVTKLAQASDALVRRAVQQLPVVKTGRPAKNQK
jgi:hypothetical protein